MSKETDLKQQSVGALRRIIGWLDMQGRVLDDSCGSWPKPDCVEFLASKLTRDEVDGLVARFDAQDPYYSDQELANVLGLPQKEKMLELSTREQLREAMERLEKKGRVEIYWRSRSPDDIRAYLRKLTREEVAQLLWDVKPKREPVAKIVDRKNASQPDESDVASGYGAASAAPAPPREPRHAHGLPRVHAAGEAEDCRSAKSAYERPEGCMNGGRSMRSSDGAPPAHVASCHAKAFASDASANADWSASGGHCFVAR